MYPGRQYDQQGLDDLVVYDQPRGGMCKYMPKGCKIQIVMASHLCNVFDMRPSTTNNPTSNQDPKVTAQRNLIKFYQSYPCFC